MNKNMIINLPEIAAQLSHKYDSTTNNYIIARILKGAGVSQAGSASIIVDIYKNPIVTITVPKSSDIRFVDSDGEIKELAGANLAKQYKKAFLILLGYSNEEDSSRLTVRYKEINKHITYETFIGNMLWIAGSDTLIDDNTREQFKKYKGQVTEEGIEALCTEATTLFAYGVSPIPIYYNTQQADLTKNIPERIAYLVPEKSKFIYNGHEIAGDAAMDFIKQQLAPENVSKCNDIIIFALPGYEVDSWLYNFITDRIDGFMQLVKELVL